MLVIRPPLGVRFLLLAVEVLVDDFAVDDRQHRADVGDLLVGHVEVVVAQHHQIGPLAFLDSPELLLPVGAEEPGFSEV